MRFCKSWALVALVCVLSLAGARPAEAQFPFEPGFEGELWQLLSPLGTRLRESCISYVDPDPNDEFPPYPDVSTLTCSDAQLAAILDEFVYPTDLVTLQIGTVPDPITQLPIPLFRLYVIDQIFGRVLTFLSGPNGTWTVDPLPGAAWNFSNALDPTLSYPETIALDAQNNVLIADWGHSRIVAYTSEGVSLGEYTLPIEVVAAAPSPGAVFGVPGSGYIAALQADGPYAHPPIEQVHILDAGTGATLWKIGGVLLSDALGEFNGPSGVVFDAQGRLVVSDYGNSRIQVFALNGTTNTWDLIAHFGEDVLQKPFSLSFDQNGRLLVSDTDNQRLLVFQPDFDNGTAHFLFELNADGGLNGFPRGVIQDPYGRLMVADLTNHEIKIFQVPDLGVYNVQLVDANGVAVNAVRDGTRVHLQFSLTVPLDHNQVTQVIPSCASGNTQLMRLVSGPTAVTGSPAGIPLAALLPGTAVRYSCEFEALRRGTVTLTAGGSGNGVDPLTGLPRTVAPARSLTRTIACATCEIDPPTISAAVVNLASGSPAVLVNGWYNQDVAVQLTAVDTGSGVDQILYRIIGGVQSGPLVTVSAPQNATQFSVNVPVTANGRTALIFWARDDNGTTSAVNALCYPSKLPTCVPDLTLFLDDEDPSVIFDFSGQGRNAAGWFKQPVSAPYSLLDTVSGLDTVTGPASPVLFNTEGIGLSAEVIAKDIAGNVTTASTLHSAYGGVGPIKIDFTPPTVYATVPAGSYAGSVAIQLIASDNLSGVQLVRYGMAGAVLQGHQTYTGTPITIATPGVTTLEFFAIDAAGNETPTFKVRYEIIANRAPVAGHTAAMTAEDTPVNATLTATDPDGTPVTFTILSVTHGTVTPNGGPSYTFTPTANYHGPALITFRASDGTLSSDGSVSLTVTSVNDAPVANADAAPTLAGVAVTVDVRANDTDADGDALTVSAAGPAAPAGAGTVEVTGAGTVRFTPSPSFLGTATFPYTISDGNGGSRAATVTISVGPLNADPDCRAATASPASIWPPNHKKTFAIGVNGVTDPDGGAITIQFTEIWQDEPTNTQGDGNTPQDGGIEPGGARAWIRAERMAGGDGRVYFLGFTATDNKSATCSGVVKVGVPHDQGKGPAVDSGVRYNSITGFIQ